jgi:hypothetical protein
MSTYTLGRACWIVRKLDGSAGRRAVFDDVVRKNRVVRFFYTIYENAPELLKYVLLILYGLKCYLSVNWRGPGNSDLAFFASYPNERVVIGHLRHQLRGFDCGALAISRANCFGPDALRDLPFYLIALPRLVRVARRLVRRFPFMPACRIFSTVAYYARFRRLLARHDTKAVFIANHYSPECLALAVAAHRSSRKVLFTNHANATWNTGYVPPLYSDLAAVTSQAVLDVYAQHSGRPIDAVFVPLALPHKPMRAGVDRRGAITVGVFLTALTNMERLQALVTQLEADPKIARILIRQHPVKVVNEDLSELCREHGRAQETGGIPLNDNIEQCDLAICGNSSVTIEILRSGVPVLYADGLDGTAYDANRYVMHGLILPLPARLDAAVFQFVERFYGDPGWLKVMRYFDAGYQQDEAAMYARLAEAVQRVVRPTPARRAATAADRGAAEPAYPLPVS